MQASGWQRGASAVCLGLLLAGCARDFDARLEKPAPVAAASTEAARSHAWPPDHCLRILDGSIPGNAETRRLATERLVELYAPALLTAPQNRLRLPGGVFLRLRRGGGPGGVEPSRFVALIPADRYVVTGVPGFNRVPGVGAPLVGTCTPTLPVTRAGPVAPVPVSDLTRTVTAVPVYERTARTLDLDLYDPRTTGRTAGRGSQPLAADFTTPLAVVTTRLKPERRGLLGLFKGDKYFGSSGLFPTEQPTTDKIPLVLVHGLISDPGDFHVLMNRLDASPEFRRRYQVWVFYYPSSLPVVYAAMMLRESMEKFIHDLDPSGTHPALHRAVLAGHSMGGLLCRMTVSDGGERFYHHFFSQPVDDLHLDAGERDLIQRALYYRACPEVSRVIFIATPHHGSQLASGPLGNLGRLLARLPAKVRARIGNVFDNNRAALVSKTQLKPGSSLDSLSPRGPTIAAINDQTMRPGVRLNSIIGDRGRGGSPEGSSDGVVPYAGSHLPEAGSERIVPAGHTGTLYRPETADEILRLLCPRQ